MHHHNFTGAMLYTNLKHIESASEYERIIHARDNVMVICGRMDTNCVPVYRIVEELESDYTQTAFYDMEFDNPESDVIRNLPEVSGLISIPFVIYYRKGEVVQTTAGIQSKAQIAAILEQDIM